MYSKTPTGKASKGSVSVASVQGRLRLQFPRSWFGGKQKYLALGLPDAPENWISADNKATQAELDYISGNFDFSLNRYKLHSLQVAQVNPLNFADLFREYIEYKTPSQEKNTIRLYKIAANKLPKFGKPIQNWNDVQSLIKWMRSQGTGDKTISKYLTDYKAAIGWGIEHGKWTAPNPFKDFTESLNIKPVGEDRRPFTKEERDRIIQAFKENRYYKYYYPLVVFRFYTGVRTGELIALRWKYIATDLSSVTISKAVVEVEGELVEKPTKNKKVRKIPLNSLVREALRAIKSENTKPDDLVFPAPKGGYLNANNFCNRAWTEILKEVGIEGEDFRPPYCTRHTFATILCSSKDPSERVPPHIVAEWMEDDVATIMKHYVKNNEDYDIPI